MSISSGGARSRRTNKLVNYLERVLFQSVYELEALSRIDASVASAEPIDTILARACQDASRCLEDATVAIVFRKGGTCFVAHSSDPSVAGRIDDWSAALQDCLTRGATTHEVEASVVQRLIPTVQPESEAVIRRADNETESFALLVAAHTEPQKRFADAHSEFLSDVAQRIAIAIRQGDLLSGQQFLSMHQRLDETPVSPSAKDRLNIGQEILQSVVEPLLELLPDESGKVQVLFPSGERHLRVVYSTQTTDTNFHVSRAQSVSGRAFGARVMQIVPQVSRDDQYASFLGADIQSECAVPVLVGNEAVAVVNVESTIPDYFSGYYGNLISQFTRRLSFPLASLRINDDITSLLEQRHAQETFDAIDLSKMDVVHRMNGALGLVRGWLERMPVREGDEAKRSKVEAALLSAESELWKLRGEMDRRQNVDANDEITALLRGKYAATSESLSVQLSPNLPLVHCPLLRDMVENLIDNALSAVASLTTNTTNISRSVLISTAHVVNVAAVNSYVQIVVSDNGVGIPAEVRENPFTLKTKSAPSSSSEGTVGMGMGLFLVRMVVAKAGGDVLISTNMNGTQIEIRLPARDGEKSHE